MSARARSMRCLNALWSIWASSLRVCRRSCDPVQRSSRFPRRAITRAATSAGASANSSAAVQRLRQLGLQVMRVAEPGRLNADSYIASEPIGNRGQAVALKLTRGAIEADSGSYYVSLNQSHANLAAAALEPDTPFSYVNNGLLPDIGSVARVTAPPSVPT